MIEWFLQFIETINSNPISAGIVGSTLIGSGMYILRELPKKIWFSFWNSVTINMTIYQDNSYLAYNSFEEELQNSKLYYLSGTFQLIYKVFRKDIDLSIGEYGLFLVKFNNGTWGLLKKYTDGQVNFWHSFIYDVRFFTRKKEKIEKYFRNIFEIQNKRSFGDQIKIYQRTVTSWEYTEKQKVPLLGYLSKDKETIKNKVEYFLNNKEEYIKKYRPYREGFILSGKPGTGKSYFIQQLASTFSLNVYYVNLSSFSSDESFTQAMLEISLPNIILLEDIDCVDITHSRKEQEETSYKEEIKSTLSKKKSSKKEEKKGISLATLLNTLDGLLAQEGQLVFLTTNHIEKLDEALIRAGRFNTNVVFDYLEYEEIKSYLERIYEIDVHTWKIKNLKITIANLSAICQNNDAKEVRKQLEEMAHVN